MKILVRVGMGLLALFALLWLAACSGAPGCPQASFGGGACTGGGGSSGFGGGGGGGGGGSGAGSTAYAYAVDQTGSTGTGQATMDGFVMSAGSSTFTAISNYTPPSVPSNGGGVGMVIAQKQYLYTGFASVQQIWGWTISSSGTLTAINGSPYTAPFLSYYISGVGQSQMITNPQGTLLFASDTLQGLIYVYTIGTGGALTAVNGSPFALPSGFEPMNMATDGLGNYLYAINGVYTTHQGSSIAAFRIGTGTSLGVLTAVTGSPFGYNMWQVQGDPTGQYLIGTTGSSAFYGATDDYHLYVFTITQSGANAGAITETEAVSTVYSPFDIAVQPNTGGNLVYSFSFNDAGTAFNPIEGYTLSNSGTLSADTTSPFTLSEGLGTWGQFDQSGTYLFLYASYLNASNTTVTQLTPFTVGTGGTLTQSFPTETLNTTGFWAVTDVP